MICVYILIRISVSYLISLILYLQDAARSCRSLLRCFTVQMVRYHPRAVGDGTRLFASASIYNCLWAPENAQHTVVSCRLSITLQLRIVILPALSARKLWPRRPAALSLPLTTVEAFTPGLHSAEPRTAWMARTCSHCRHRHSPAAPTYCSRRRRPYTMRLVQVRR